jgi:hypothetical protein
MVSVSQAHIYYWALATENKACPAVLLTLSLMARLYTMEILQVKQCLSISVHYPPRRLPTHQSTIESQVRKDMQRLSEVAIPTPLHARWQPNTML